LLRNRARLAYRSTFRAPEPNFVSADTAFEDPAEMREGLAELGRIAAVSQHPHHVAGRHRAAVYGGDHAQDVRPVLAYPGQIDATPRAMAYSPDERSLATVGAALTKPGRSGASPRRTCRVGRRRRAARPNTLSNRVRRCEPFGPWKEHSPSCVRSRPARRP
jgi:hypothetical protein